MSSEPSIGETDLIYVLNEQLDGSPYLLQDDEDGLARATTLIRTVTEIEARSHLVEESFQSQSQEIRALIDSMIGAQVVYESNALEGIGLSLADTRTALEEASADLKEIRDVEALRIYLVRRGLLADSHLVDVLGLNRANDFARELVQDYRDSAAPLREVDIRSLHSLIVPMARHAGHYRAVEVRIKGSGHTPSSVVDVPRQMRELTEWFNSMKAPAPLASAVVHSWLTHIHPFEDGNGRMARLLANIALLKAGWPPLIIRSSDRLQYLDALAHSDQGGDLLPLFGLFVKSMNRSLLELEKPDLAFRLFEADLTDNSENRHRVWSGQITSFLNQLGRDLTEYGFELSRLVEPSASAMLLLESESSEGETWLATLTDHRGRDYLIWVGVMSPRQHSHVRADRASPSIFFSERDPANRGSEPYRTKSDISPLPIDEVTIIPKLAHKCVLARFGLSLVDMELAEAASQVALFFSRAVPATAH